MVRAGLRVTLLPASQQRAEKLHPSLPLVNLPLAIGACWVPLSALTCLLSPKLSSLQVRCSLSVSSCGPAAHAWPTLRSPCDVVLLGDRTVQVPAVLWLGLQGWTAGVAASSSALSGAHGSEWPIKFVRARRRGYQWIPGAFIRAGLLLYCIHTGLRRQEICWLWPAPSLPSAASALSWCAPNLACRRVHDASAPR